VKKLLSSSNKSAFNTAKIKNAYLDDQVLVELLGDKQPLAHKLFENSTKILNQNTKSRLFSMELMYMMGNMMHEVDPFASSSLEEESLAVD
jgi:hypothetical protein